MWKIMHTGWFLLIGVALGLLHGIFEYVGDRLEPQLFANGHEARWWGIVLSYWLIDTAVVLYAAHLMRWPIDTRLPGRIPFLQLASDLAVVTFLLHLGWLTRDRNLHEKLASIGLSGLSQFLFIVALAWIIIVNFRYQKIREAADVVRQKMARSGSRGGPRALTSWAPSFGRYNNRPK